MRSIAIVDLEGNVLYTTNSQVLIIPSVGDTVVISGTEYIVREVVHHIEFSRVTVYVE